ncbi:MAG: beta-lactamase family protein [Sphingomonadales bacterium]|nr:beta-lactamase family protein [Sphingomonadales bacterium]
MLHETIIARRGFLGALVAGGALLHSGAALALVKASESYPALDAFIRGFVARKQLPGALATVGKGATAPHVIAVGTIANDSEKQVDIDTLWRLYSMTKPVTGMAAMILIGDGKLALDQPLSDFLPAFAKMKVLKSANGPVNETVDARTQITIRHLLTHTAGLGYNIIQSGPIKDAYVREGILPGQVSRISIPGLDTGTPAPSLEEFADRLATLPLVYEPGTKWSYSVGLDLMGRVIELASGMPFDQYLSQRIFTPLAMKSSFFRVPQSQVARLTTNYAPLGPLLMPIDVGSNSIYLDTPAFPFGGSGLVGSARDYDRFQAMLLGEGAIGDVRIMAPETARLGMSNLLPAGVDTKGSFVDGEGFGAGGRVGLTGGPREGVYGWAGAAGTIGWVDRKRGLRIAAYAQYMPAEALPFQSGVPAAIARDLA